MASIKQYHIAVEDERIARVVTGLLLENGYMAELIPVPEDTKKEVPALLRIADIELDTVHQVLTTPAGRTDLTGKESELLCMLMQHEGQLVPRSEILQTIWGQDDFFVSRSLSVYMNKVRQFLAPTHLTIIGIRGKGYKLVVTTD